MRNMRTATQPKTSDIICIGFQKMPGGGGFFLYQDMVTKTSFAVHPGETLEEARDRKIKEFQDNPPIEFELGNVCPGRR